MTIGAPESDPLLPPRRPWGRSLLLGFIILACGIAIGSVATAVIAERDDDHGPRKFGRDPEGIARRMQEEYDLSDEQTQRLQAVFREHWDKLSAIRAEVQPRVDAEFEALKDAVQTILTPEQARRWREEFERKRQYWHSRPGRMPGAGGPPGSAEPHKER